MTSSFGRRAVVVWREYSKIDQQFFSDGASVWSSHHHNPSRLGTLHRSEMGKQEPKSERPTPVHTSLFVERHPTVARRSRPDVPRAPKRPAPKTEPLTPTRLPRPISASADSRFTQQQLPAWRPTLTPMAVRPSLVAHAMKATRTVRSIAGPTADLTRVPTFPPPPSQTRPRVPTSPPPTTH